MDSFENIECSTLCKTYRLHVEDAVFAKGFIPRKILLDSTRNIHSYLVFCKIDNGIIISSYWQKNNFRNSLISMLSVQYSDLDRPLFFLFRETKDKYKVIEGNELREVILDNPRIDIIEYIKQNSYQLTDLLLRLNNEL